MSSSAQSPPASPRVHTSAHPSLPPAQTQQVIQFLLARNYYLTALELLVESQHAGNSDEVKELQLFFSDAERFPPDEVAKHQSVNALDLQAASREREERLQLAEYELRLAKEDLAEACKRSEALAAQLASARLQSTPSVRHTRSSSIMSAGSSGGAAAAGATVTPAAPAALPSALQRISSDGQGALARMDAAVELPPAVAEEAEEGDGGAAGDGAAAGAAGAAGSHRQLPAAQLLSSHYQQRLDGGGGGAGPGLGGGVAGSGVGGGEEELSDEEEEQQGLTGSGGFDWSKLGEPTEPDIQAMNTAVLSYLVRQGFKTAAITLEEEAGPQGLLPSPSLASHHHPQHHSGGGGRGSFSGSLGGGGAGQQLQHHAGEELFAWFKTSRSPVFRLGLAGAVAEAEAKAEASHARESAASQAHQQQLAALQEQLAAGKRQLAEAQAQLAECRRRMDQLTSAAASSSAWTAKDAGAAAAVASDVPAGAAAGGGAGGAGSGSGEARGLLATRSSYGSESLSRAGSTPPKQAPPPIDPRLHASLAAVVSCLVDTLPRVVPNLTIKSRLEVLPLVQALVGTHPASDVRRVLLGLIFNLVASPDTEQRAAMVSACASVAAEYGPGWAAQEVLGLCVKQVSSPSSERRTLVASMLGALAGRGLVDLGAHAHVVLTQLHRLSEDRLEQVREAAVSSVVQLLSRLPYSRPYYLTIEDMVMTLARDGSEAIFKAVDGSLLPALQAWAADADVVTSSLLPKVITEMGRHVRQAAAAGGAGAAGAGAAPGTPTSYTGSVLSYSLAPAAGAGGADGAAAAADGNSAAAGAVGGSEGSFTVASSGAGRPPPAPTPPKPLLLGSQGFNSRKFASHDHQAAHQLLGLYCSLLPALRSTALRNCPAWALAAAAAAAPAASPTAAGAGAEKQGQQAGGGGGSEGAAAPSAASDGAAAAAGEAGELPNPFGTSTAATRAAAGAAASGGSVGGAGGASLPLSGSISSLPHSVSSSLHRSSSHPHLLLVNAEEQGEVPPDALFGAWASSEQHMQWKAVHWVVQFLLPELIDAAKAVPVAGAGVVDTWELRKQFARALLATGTTFGPAFSRAVLVPLLTSAAGALNVSQPSGPVTILSQPVPGHLQESAADLQPRTPEAARLCRERVLPLLVAAALPAAGVLQPYLCQLLGAADGLQNRWLMESLQDLVSAFAFACRFNDHHVGDLLQVLETVVSDARSTAAGLCAVALARGVLPAAAADHMSRRVMPPLMVLLGQGDGSVQLAVVHTLIEVLLRFREESRLVEQVFVVYDGLLEAGSHEIQAAVLACGTRLAAAVSGTAARSASAASQLEWLLGVIQALAHQLQGASPAPPRSQEQQRALAAQLVHVTATAHSYDVRLPRMQSALQGCIESLQRCKPLLGEPQLAALSAMSHGSGGSGGSNHHHHHKNRSGGLAASSSSSSITAPTAPAAPTAAPPGASSAAVGAAAPGAGPAAAAAGAAMPPELRYGGSSVAPGGGAPGGAGGAQAGEEKGMRSRFKKFTEKFKRTNGPDAAGGSAGHALQPGALPSASFPAPSPGSAAAFAAGHYMVPPSPYRPPPPAQQQQQQEAPPVPPVQQQQQAQAQVQQSAQGVPAVPASPLPAAAEPPAATAVTPVPSTTPSGPSGILQYQGGVVGPLGPLGPTAPPTAPTATAPSWQPPEPLTGNLFSDDEEPGM